MPKARGPAPCEVAILRCPRCATCPRSSAGRSVSLPAAGGAPEPWRCGGRLRASGRLLIGSRRFPSQPRTMPLPDGAIRAKRKLTNRLIAAHDAARLRAHLTDDMLLIVGDGDLIGGADAVVAAFASQFADPDFVAYVRTTDAVELADDGHRAAETGRWVGNWKGGVEVS